MGRVRLKAKVIVNVRTYAIDIAVEDSTKRFVALRPPRRVARDGPKILFRRSVKLDLTEKITHLRTDFRNTSGAFLENFDRRERERGMDAHQLCVDFGTARILLHANRFGRCGPVFWVSQ